MKKKIVYVISLIENSLLFEWILDDLHKQFGENLLCILLHYKETTFEKKLIDKGIRTQRVFYRKKKNVPYAIIRTYKILKRERPDIIHTHLFEAGIIGMIAAKALGIKKRIHTRHDAMIHHDFFPNAVKYDKLTNNIATDIIAISNNVKNILINLENVKESKVKVIHHGFKLDTFRNVPESRINLIRTKYNLNNSPIIGVVSRMIEWKGIQFIIPAFEKLLNSHPESILVLANAKGTYKEKIIELLSSIPDKNYRLIEYENDMPALYKCFNVFVHTPVDKHSEAFGQVYVESLASQLPCVFTLSGIACDFAKNDVNAKIAQFKNSESIYSGIYEIITNVNLKDELINKSYSSISDEFDYNVMMNKINKLYV